MFNHRNVANFADYRTSDPFKHVAETHGTAQDAIQRAAAKGARAERRTTRARRAGTVLLLGTGLTMAAKAGLFTDSVPATSDGPTKPTPEQAAALNYGIQAQATKTSEVPKVHVIFDKPDPAHPEDNYKATIYGQVHHLADEGAIDPDHIDSTIAKVSADHHNGVVQPTEGADIEVDRLPLIDLDASPPAAGR